MLVHEHGLSKSCGGKSFIVVELPQCPKLACERMNGYYALKCKFDIITAHKVLLIGCLFIGEVVGTEL